MNRFSFEKNFGIALFAYLRQAELSIHRTGKSWGNLLEYYNTEAISPKIVVNTIKNRLNEYPQFSSQIFSKKHFQQPQRQRGFFSWSHKLWNWYINNNIILRENEFIFIYHSLLEFEKALTDIQLPLSEYVISIRLDLNISCNIIERNIPITYFCEKARHIEHFNQNEHLVLLPLSEIVDDKYLKIFPI